MKIREIEIRYPENQRILSSQDFDGDEASYRQFLHQVGVEKRHLSEPGETASDLVLLPAQRMLEKFPAETVDFLIFSSLTLDFKTPTTSSVLHHKLGLKKNCGVMDLPYGCAGFPMALSMVKGLFLNPNIQNVLILLGEIPSQAIHSKDRELKFLFGDAGVAVWVEKEEIENESNFVFGNDGEGFNYLNVLKGGSKFPFDEMFLLAYKNEPQIQRQGRISMDGLGILKMVLKHVPEAVHSILETNKVTAEEIDHYLFHQASNLVLNAIQKKCNIPPEKMIYQMKDSGNTVSCSIPIAWKKTELEGRFKPGDKILILGFGVGFSWCGTLLRYESI